jgi:NAD(P)-dependent dehydrogenase (short-subunit alcohol dehydrogenase family)
MRSVDDGMARLRERTGATADDPRLSPITLDLLDTGSIAGAVKAIRETSGVPDALVHNAGIAAVACVEEMPADATEEVFTTNFFGPVQLTKELLPDMRAARTGRIVVVSSMGGLRGMPATSAYSAAKAALERWAESLAFEIAPFGLGVTVLVTGTYATDIIGVSVRQYSDKSGPYAGLYAPLDRMEPKVHRLARDPAQFARHLAAALEDDRPFARRTSGLDATMMSALHRLIPARAFAALVRGATRIPRAGSMR